MYVYFGQGGDSAGPNFMLDKHIECVVLGTQGICPNPLNPTPSSRSTPGSASMLTKQSTFRSSTNLGHASLYREVVLCGMNEVE